MKQELVYPDMELICRLCLKERTGCVSVFTDQLPVSAGNQANMSIPMRIMACAALEVQTNDGLPKKICTECRYQLEKSYLFRKQSQASDAKLRKHIRLIGLGKLSRVFQKNPDEDDDDDEFEFYDSLEFIRKHEEKLKMKEQLKLKNLEAKMRAEKEIELEECKDELKAKCREELRAEVEESVRTELRPQIQEETEKELIPKIRRECYQEARKSLRDECRQIEMKILLDDLQCYLRDKHRIVSDPLNQDDAVTQNIYRFHPTDNEAVSGSKRKTSEGVTSDSAKKAKCHNSSKKPLAANIKPELILNYNRSDMDINTNDDDGDSDNFLIYDTDEGFEVQKKSETGGGDEGEDTFIEGQLQSCESSVDQLVTSNGQENQKSSTIVSYRIADNDNREITFLKKALQLQTTFEDNDDNNDGQLNDDNIMIINYPSEIDDEEHLDMLEYTDEDDNNKNEKAILSAEQSIKRHNSTAESNEIFTNTTSTVETTLMTKTYVNTVQRFTDTPKTFKCTDCPMVFSSKHSLERHVRIHRREGVTFQCSECQIVVSCSSALRRHMFTHCERKPFTCLECGKSFVQKEILKRHMQTHTGIKPHKCPHCNREFAQRINLKQHINRHHLEEPRIQQHSCHLCPKRFNHASGLSRHLATHSGVAFQCSECDRTFVDRSSIKRHIANKHRKGQVEKSEKHTDGNNF